MEQLPWWIWVIFAGVAYALTINILKGVHAHRLRLAEIQAGIPAREVGAPASDILGKLDIIETRLLKVERFQSNQSA